MTNTLRKMVSSLRNSSERRTGDDKDSQQPNLMANTDVPVTSKGGSTLANIFNNKPVVKVNSHVLNGDGNDADGNNNNNSGGVGGDDEVDDRVLIERVHYASHLATSWTQRRKWCILIIGGLAQLAMNLNTTLYSNAQKGVAEYYGVTVSQAVWGAAAFLITYAFGCELWAPWSEEFGRRPILQLSMMLVNCCCFLAALAPNFPVLIIARAPGRPEHRRRLRHPRHDHRHYATNFMSLASLLGSIVGAVVGGFIEANLPWSWCLWVQLIFGGIVQMVHLFSVPETRSTVVMDQVAQKLRKAAEEAGDENDPMLNVYGPGELDESDGFGWREYADAQWRPFSMLLREPIVTALALLSGFSDALIFMFVQSFGLIYGRDLNGVGWGFGTIGVSLAFIPIGLGYVLRYLSFIPAIRRNTALRKANPNSEHAQYEARLWWLNFTAPALSVGLLIFAFVACLPGVTEHVPWWPSMVASCLIGIANYAIYMATIDYTLRAYGVYAASATGGNGWARDFLAGILTPFAVPLFEEVGKFPMMMILFGLALLLTVSVYVVYFKGPWLRHRSKFAQTLASRGEEETAAHQATTGGVVENNNDDDSHNNGGDDPEHGTSIAPTAVSRAYVQYLGKQELPGSRASSRVNSPRVRKSTPRQVRPAAASN
ncbi:hypothetical protein PG994_003705 [Apiospora phragmitis]|uniref:Uncharacterized protein n=1 Tax=Apiospora phragmitis TaxID=2905665 RepID=A0ABR1VYZ6_9PEZI